MPLGLDVLSRFLELTDRNDQRRNPDVVFGHHRNVLRHATVFEHGVLRQPWQAPADVNRCLWFFLLLFHSQ